MATLIGFEGSMTLGGGTVAEIKNFKVTTTAASIPNNAMGSGAWNSSKTGRKSWTGEVACHYDPDDATGQGVAAVGDEVACVFLPAGDTTGNVTHSGTGRVTEVTISADGEGDSLVEFDVKVEGVGALTEGTVA